MTPVPGKRLFIAASIVLLLFGGTHLATVIRSRVHPPATPAEARLKADMQAHRDRVGPITLSAWDAVQILSASYSTLLFYVGALNLSAAGAAAQAGGLRRLTAVNMVFCALVLAIPGIFLFLPPMVFSAAALVLFMLSWHRQRGAAIPPTIG